ncbi:MAG: helix-turn-helix domain-containing protein [Bacillota bacterium]|nr:helix-turn-helix domain-containing protein [Bacillota bacterium]
MKREELVGDGLLGVEEAADFLGVRRSLLYVLMGRRELPWTKIGRRRLIPRRALVELAARELRGGDHE